jgi:hypothetical protein
MLTRSTRIHFDVRSAEKYAALHSLMPNSSCIRALQCQDIADSQAYAF